MYFLLTRFSTRPFLSFGRRQFANNHFWLFYETNLTSAGKFHPEEIFFFHFQTKILSRLKYQKTNILNLFHKSFSIFNSNWLYCFFVLIYKCCHFDFEVDKGESFISHFLEDFMDSYGSNSCLPVGKFSPRYIKVSDG